MVKYFYSVNIPQCLAACPFRMRHHAKYIPVPVTDAGDMVNGPIGVSRCSYASLLIAVPVDHLAVHFHFFQCSFIGKKTSFAMSHRDHQGLTPFSSRFPDKNIFTNKLLPAVA